MMQKHISFIVNCYDLIFIFYYLLFRHMYIVNRKNYILLLLTHILFFQSCTHSFQDSTNLRFESWRTRWYNNKADLGPVGSFHSGWGFDTDKQNFGSKMDQEKDCQPKSSIVLVDSTFEENSAHLNLKYYPYSDAGLTINGPWQTEVHGSKFLNNVGGWLNNNNVSFF